jgi:Zn-dependent alcohol dehydrogenase
MKAAVIRAAHDWSIEDGVELAAPRADEVLVRIVATGLCHSDVGAFAGMMPTPLPLVPGHEGAGIVEAVGPGVVDLEPGDHVVLSVVVSCGTCFQCRSGAPSLCEVSLPMALAGCLLDGSSRLSNNGETLQHFLCQSSFAEYAVVPRATAVKVRRDAPLDVVCLLGCGAMTGIGAVVKRAAVRPGEGVMVLGVGGVGLAAILGARLVGAYPIVAIDRSRAALDAAADLGATHLVDATDGDAAEKVVEITGRGIDHAIDVVGGEGTLETCLASVRAGGQVVVAGISSGAARGTVDVYSMIMEKRVTGTGGGSANPQVDIPWCVDLFMDGRLPLDRLATSTYDLDHLDQALLDIEHGRVGRGVIVQS